MSEPADDKYDSNFVSGPPFTSSKRFDQFIPGNVSIYPIIKDHVPKFNVDVPLGVWPVLCYCKPQMVKDVQAYPDEFLKLLRRSSVGPKKAINQNILSIASAFLGDIKFLLKCPPWISELIVQLFLESPPLTKQSVAKEHYGTVYFCIQAIGNISMFCKKSADSPEQKLAELEDFKPFIEPIRAAGDAITERLWREREFFMEDIPAYNIAILLLGLVSMSPPPNVPSHLLQCAGHWWLNTTSSYFMHTIIATAVSSALYSDNQSYTPIQLETQFFTCTEGKVAPFAIAANNRLVTSNVRGPHFQWSIHMTMLLASHDAPEICRCTGNHPDSSTLLLVELRKLGYLKTVVRVANDEFQLHQKMIRDGTVRSLGTLINALSKFCLVQDLYIALEEGLLELLKKCIVGRTVPQDLTPYDHILHNMIAYVQQNPIIARIISKRIPKIKGIKGFAFQQTKECWVILSEISDAVKAIRKHCANPSCPMSDLEPEEWDKYDTKVCAKCKSVYYCSRDCQSADWKFHKALCFCWRRENRIVQ